MADPLSYDSLCNFEYRPTTQGASLRLLGSGTYGSVEEAMLHSPSSPQPRKVAIKFMELERNMCYKTRMVKRETLNHNRLVHPFIVELQDIVLDSSQPGSCRIGLVMELAMCDLASYIHRHNPTRGMPEKLVRSFFQQLMCAVDHCHSCDIVQRDIKPRNILIFNDRMVKLADFGWSKRVDTSLARTMAGTVHSAAPEVFQDALLPRSPGSAPRPPQPYAPAPADVWSCGVVLFSMLFPSRYNSILAAHPPHDTTPITGWVDWIPADHSRSPESVRLLQRMLQEDPLARPSVRAIMQDEWFGSLPPTLSQYIAQHIQARGSGFNAEELEVWLDDVLGRYMCWSPTCLACNPPAGA